MMLLAFVAATAIAACMTFSATDDTQPGTSADGGGGQEGAVGNGADAAGPDAIGSDDSAPGDAAVADTGNLLTNGGFEQGCTSPTWGTNVANVYEDMTARTGAKSCRVCGKPNQGSWSINQEVPLPLAAGQKYQAEAWIRTPPTDAAADPISCVVEARIGFNIMQSVVTIPESATAVWHRLLCTITLTDAGAAGTKMHMGIITNTAGGCFLIDDAALYRLQ